MARTLANTSTLSPFIQDAITLQPRIRLREINFAEPATRDPLGPTPALDTVREIVSAATYSEASLQTEHGWNCAVHYPLIQIALGIRRRDEAPLVDFTSWYVFGKGMDSSRAVPLITREMLTCTTTL